MRFGYRFIWMVLILAGLSFAACQEITDSGEDAELDGGDTGGDDTGEDTADCGAGILTGDVVVTTEAELAALQGYVGIDGKLAIECPTCTDLDDLSCLESVTGRLTIDGNTVLENLDGLSSLTGTMHFIRVHNNPSLTSIEGLLGVTETEWSLTISENPLLPDLDGLDNIGSVGGELTVNGCDSLTDLAPLSGLTHLGCLPYEIGAYSLTITDNPLLESIAALGSVDEFTCFCQISNNPSLVSLAGLENMVEPSLLDISDNDSLIDLTGLSSLTGVSIEFLSISSNASLASLEGVNESAQFYSLSIIDNASLPNCLICDFVGDHFDPDGDLYVQQNQHDACTPVPGGCL